VSTQPPGKVAGDGGGGEKTKKGGGGGGGDGGGGGGGGEKTKTGGGGGGDSCGVPPHELEQRESALHKSSHVAAQMTFMGLARVKPGGGDHPVVPPKPPTSSSTSAWNSAAVLAHALVTS